MMKYKIGLVMKSLQADFFRAMLKGAIAFAESNPSIELICEGTNSQTEVDEQVGIMHKLIAQKVDAIVLVPIDSKALVVPAVKAIEAGIPVVNIDILLDKNMLEEAKINIPFVGPDNLSAAFEVGKLLSHHLKRGDEVALIEGLPVADNARQRKDGFIKAIDEAGLKLVASMPADWETIKAAEVYEKIWQHHPGIKGVFCSNDAMALGVLDIMQKQNKYLPIVGFDNDESIQPYLKEGKLLATVDIFSSQMAVYGIEYALKMLQGEASDCGIYQTPYKIVEAN